jgi:hypothetical protein
MADEVTMVTVDGIRYRSDEAPAPKKAPAKSTPAKSAPAAKNKARQPAPAADAGDSGTVSTK